MLRCTDPCGCHVPRVGATRAGIALIEVLLALVVLGVGIGAAVQASAACARVLRFAEQEQAALFAIEAVLDSLASSGGGSGASDRAGRELRWSVVDRDGLPVIELVEVGPAAAAGRSYAIVTWPVVVIP